MLLDSSLALLNAIEGVRIPCLCILSSNTNIILYARTLGSFLISFRSPISLLSLYLVLSNWFFGSFDCFLLPLKFVLLVIYLQSVILNMVWAPPHMCIWLYSFYEKCTLWGGTHPIFVSQFLHPFRYLLSMGEKFRGFKGNGFILKIGLFLSVCLSCISYLLCVAWLNIYIVETLPKVKLDNICNEMQVHHTCIYCGGVCSIYILVLLTSLALVVLCVSRIGFDMW
jgi:hypothetical protein